MLLLLLSLILQSFVGFGFLKRPFQALQLKAISSQVWTFFALISLHTPSSHLIPGLPVRRLPIGSCTNILFTIPYQSILCMYHKLLIPLNFNKLYNVRCIN